MISIAIVDDHEVVRSGLRQFFNSHPDLRVVGEGRNGHDAIQLARKCHLDVLVMDLCMPGQNGLDALASIVAKAPGVGVLVLSGYSEALYAVELIRRGARGFLNKTCLPEEIVRAIRVIAQGKVYLTAAVAKLWEQALREAKARRVDPRQLKAPERASGLTLAQPLDSGDARTARQNQLQSAGR